MQIKTIAEFVEDTDTLAAVRDVGIDYAQGYAIAKPVPIEIGLYSDPLDAGILLEENRPVNLKTASGNN
jgi:EAL domain-containing protein (putative c-di-GMP-specific phosphodiesterase class I)